jgi:hypothetical protein
MPFGKKSSVTIVNEAGETSKDWLGSGEPFDETGLTPAPRTSRQSLIINRDNLPPLRLCGLASLFS